MGSWRGPQFHPPHPPPTYQTCSLIFFPSMSTVRILKSIPGMEGERQGLMMTSEADAINSSTPSPSPQFPSNHLASQERWGEQSSSPAPAAAGGRGSPASLSLLDRAFLQNSITPHGCLPCCPCWGGRGGCRDQRKGAAGPPPIKSTSPKSCQMPPQTPMSLQPPPPTHTWLCFRTPCFRG